MFTGELPSSLLEINFYTGKASYLGMNSGAGIRFAAMPGSSRFFGVSYTSFNQLAVLSAIDLVTPDITLVGDCYPSAAPKGLECVPNSPQQPMPDLVVSKLSLASTNIVAGSGTTLNFTVTNMGNAAAPGSVAGIRLVPGLLPTTAGVEIARANVPAISPDGSLAMSENIQIPSQTVPGVYRIDVTIGLEGAVQNDANTERTIPITVTAIPVSLPPTIMVHPRNQSAPVGAKVTFSVAASGTAPLRYEWRKDGTVIDGATDANLILTNVQPGSAGAYDVVVSNAAGKTTSMPVFLAIEPATGPVNDLFASRSGLTGSRISLETSNVYSTRELGEPSHAGKLAANSLWWSWTPEQSGKVMVSTFGSSVDTLLGIYSGNSLSNLTSVASNDNDPNGDRTSRLTFDAVAGIEYQIAVDSFGGETGKISLSIEMSELTKPSIRIEQSGGDVIIFWPVNLNGFELQVSDSLRSPTWKPIAARPAVVGSEYSLRITLRACQ